MNRFFTLLLAASCLTAVGQECFQGCIIPDAVGECFAYDFEVNQFPPGQFIQDASTEIENLFINMEHSYMGDLVIVFICPNGQSIMVHPLGVGGGTFLGVPVDNDADPNTPGIGFDYSWDPSATNGTWVDNAGWGTLPAGSYESLQAFANLDGCPLNGLWEVEICDLLESDNGFVFDFGINFINDFGPGCTDSLACNYNINATEDDGSCTELDECGVCGGEGIPVGNCDCNGNQFDAVGMCGGGCTSDINNNGVCDDQEVPGCTYAFAENYNPDATDDDGSCTVAECDLPEGDGCNLEGDLNGDGFVGTGDLLDFLTQFGAECTPETAFTCGDPLSYQGYDYETVQIGDQCWFAENLRAENYRNGQTLLGELDGDAWESTIEGAQAIYGNDPGNLIEYGRLYNGYAVLDARGLCPLSWHVPSDSEWAELEFFLGMAADEVGASGWRGTVEGESLKSISGWSGNGGGNNTSGFNAKPGGIRYLGDFNYVFTNSTIWSSTLGTTGDLLYRHLYFGESRIQRASLSNEIGFSVRCLKD